jgi:hypothetical protein
MKQLLAEIIKGSSYELSVLRQQIQEIKSISEESIGTLLLIYLSENIHCKMRFLTLSTLMQYRILGFIKWNIECFEGRKLSKFKENAMRQARNKELAPIFSQLVGEEVENRVCFCKEPPEDQTPAIYDTKAFLDTRPLLDVFDLSQIPLLGSKQVKKSLESLDLASIDDFTISKWLISWFELNQTISFTSIVLSSLVARKIKQLAALPISLANTIQRCLDRTPSAVIRGLAEVLLQEQTLNAASIETLRLIISKQTSPLLLDLTLNRRDFPLALLQLLLQRLSLDDQQIERVLQWLSNQPSDTKHGVFLLQLIEQNKHKLQGFKPRLLQLAEQSEIAVALKDKVNEVI